MKTLKTLALTLFTLLLLINTGCKKETPIETPELKVPTVNTAEVTNITNTTAGTGGEVVSDGGETVLSRGVCWSTDIKPTINDSKTENGDGAGFYSSSITGLTKLTTYYVRAYATNKNGTGYGAAMSFTTSSSFYFTPTTAPRGNTVTVSFFGGDEVTFSQGTNCPSIKAMAQLRQGTSTILYPSNITYIDSTHFNATFDISSGAYTGSYDMKVGTNPCARTEYNSFQITN